MGLRSHAVLYIVELGKIIVSHQIIYLLHLVKYNKSCSKQLI